MLDCTILPAEKQLDPAPRQDVQIPRPDVYGNSMVKFEFRQYDARDQNGCLEVFDSNVPKYFREHERVDFESFIQKAEFPYYIVLADKKIIGCGGYAVNSPNGLADLCWGMISNSYHGTGLGEFLLLGRLNAIIEGGETRGVRLGTSQLTEGFFEKYGFATLSTEPDGIAQELDEAEMQMEFTPETTGLIVELWQSKLKELDASG